MKKAAAIFIQLVSCTSIHAQNTNINTDSTNTEHHFQVVSVEISTLNPTPYVRDFFTQKPIETPSIALSYNPTVLPSLLPSTVPSVLSSSTPSEGPSVDPSEAPSTTQRPSMMPSFVPSVSLSPSSNPSFIPSSSPSVTPSSTPSNTPSLIPSSTPTMTPSVKASESPTSIPTLNPTPSVLLVETYVTLWGITVGNSKDQVLKFGKITQNFLNEHVSTKDYPTYDYALDEIRGRSLTIEDFSVEIVKVEVTQVIRDGETFNVGNDGSESLNSNESSESHDDIRDTAINPESHDNGSVGSIGSIGEVQIDEDEFLIGIRVAPKAAGEDLIDNNAVLIRITYEVKPYNPPESFDYMNAALWGFKYEMESYQNLIFREQPDVLGIAGLIAADAMGEDKRSLKFTYIDGIIISAGFITICALSYLYFQEKNQKQKTGQNDGSCHSGSGGKSPRVGLILPELTFSKGHDDNDGGFRLRTELHRYGCASKDSTQVISNRKSPNQISGVNEFISNKK